MDQDPRGLYGLAGMALMASGVLFLTRDLLDALAGPVPSTGQEILAWVDSSRIAIAMGLEILFFAAISSIPALFALYDSFASVGWARSALACGLFATAVAMLAVLDVVGGRLVFPVYGLRVTAPPTAELVVAIFYGGLHAVNLLLATATLLIGHVMRSRDDWKDLSPLSIAAAVAHVVKAYAYAIGIPATIVTQVVITAWFVAVGRRLLRLRSGSRASVEP